MYENKCLEKERLAVNDVCNNNKFRVQNNIEFEKFLRVLLIFYEILQLVEHSIKEVETKAAAI